MGCTSSNSAHAPATVEKLPQNPVVNLPEPPPVRIVHAPPEIVAPVRVVSQDPNSYGPSQSTSPVVNLCANITRANGFEIHLHVCSDLLVPKRNNAGPIYMLMYESINTAAVTTNMEDNELINCFTVVHPDELPEDGEEPKESQVGMVIVLACTVRCTLSTAHVVL